MTQLYGFLAVAVHTVLLGFFVAVYGILAAWHAAWWVFLAVGLVHVGTASLLIRWSVFLPYEEALWP